MAERQPGTESDRKTKGRRGRPQTPVAEGSFGAQIRELREGLGLSIEEVCRRAGWNPRNGYLSAVEHNRFGASTKRKMRALASVLGIEIDTSTHPPTIRRPH